MTDQCGLFSSSGVKLYLTYFPLFLHFCVTLRKFTIIQNPALHEYKNSSHGSSHCLCKWPLFELASFTDVPIGFSVHKMRAEDPDDQSTLNFFVVEPITAITPDGVLVDRSLYNITVCITGCWIVHVTSYKGIFSVNCFYLSTSINFISPILFMDVIFKWGCCSLCILFVDIMGNPFPQIWLTSCIDFYIFWYEK